MVGSEWLEPLEAIVDRRPIRSEPSGGYRRGDQEEKRALGEGKIDLPRERFSSTLTLTGRGERMRASGPVERAVGQDGSSCHLPRSSFEGRPATVHSLRSASAVAASGIARVRGRFMRRREPTFLAAR